MEIDINELAEQLGAEIANPPSGALAITGLSALFDATPGDLSFFHHERYLDDLKATAAGAVLVARDFDHESAGVSATLLKVESPSLAFDEISRDFLAAARPAVRFGVHPSAVVGEGVDFDAEKVAIGANVVIGDGSRIGDGSEIGAGSVIGANCVLGADCKLHANVTLYDRTELGARVILNSGCVLGSDGFGYELKDGVHQKIEHFGYVQAGDDVEIGANTTVDRGRFGRTSIGEGTKIDNVVQIGHNVTIGKHCIFVADTAIAGSTRFGDYVTVAAQVGFAGHLEIGSFTVFIARSGVTKSVPGGTPDKPAFYSGFPAGPASVLRKEMVYPRRVPSILKRLKALEEKLGK